MIQSKKLYEQFWDDMLILSPDYELGRFTTYKSLPEDYKRKCLGLLFADLSESDLHTAFDLVVDAVVSEDRIISLISDIILNPSSDKIKPFVDFMLDQCQEEANSCMEEIYDSVCEDFYRDYIVALRVDQRIPFNIQHEIEFVNRKHYPELFL